MKLLLAIDGSRFSEAATQAVILEYPPQGLEVKVLNVVDLPLPIPTSDAAGFRELSLKYGHEVVDHAEHLLSKAGYKTQTEVEEGDPNSTIIDQAKRWKADVIVMGSHGRKGVNRFLMGSVAETVSRHATCSVEIVRVNGH
jgi:nucleotide-binding universal stress UspA family protein